VFANQADQLAMPPERLAMVIRTALHGLVLELSFARTPTQLRKVEQTYLDLREMFAQVVLSGPFSSKVTP